jgi:ubiquinone/menaquinone biosynthesis C-methylase UbiE
MVEDFHAYERTLGERFLVPLLEREGVALEGKHVLDAGCGYGGVLAALAARHRLASAHGVDLDAEMVARGRERCGPGVQLEVGDFFALAGKTYDVILLRDVLEHIVDVEGAFAQAHRLLNRSGTLFASFAPFYSPFGGHQHNGAGFASRLPWLQLLPEGMFRSLLRLPGNSYKSGASLSADMETVLATRLTLARFRRAAEAAGFRMIYRAQYLSRPDYAVKFGLPQVAFPAVPVLDELLCTGAEALLTPAGNRS